MGQNVIGQRDCKILFKYNMSRKKVRDKLIFCTKISIKVSYRLIELYLVNVSRHAESTQNSKFADLSNILRKKLELNLIFLHVDKHQVLLQIDAINFCGDDQSCPNYQKKQFFKIFAICQDWSGVLMKLYYGNKCP